MMYFFFWMNYIEWSELSWVNEWIVMHINVNNRESEWVRENKNVGKNYVCGTQKKKK